MAKKSKKRRSRAAKSRKFESVPKGFHSVTPYLAIKGAAQAVKWYKMEQKRQEAMKMFGQGQHS